MDLLNQKNPQRRLRLVKRPCNRPDCGVGVLRMNKGGGFARSHRRSGDDFNPSVPQFLSQIDQLAEG